MQNQGTNIFRLVTLLADSALLLVLFVVIGYWRFDDLRIANPEYYNYYLQLGVKKVSRGRSTLPLAGPPIHNSMLIYLALNCFV